MKKIILLFFVFMSGVSADAQELIYGASGSGYSFPEQMTVFNDKMYFVMSNGVTGKEMYVSDGTHDGTALLKDIYTGTGNSDPQYFTLADSLLFFSATTSANGAELWQTDGTAAGTKLVYDIASGTSYSSPQQLYYYNGKLFFTADDGTHGYELWMHDVVTKSTTLILDIYSGPNGSNIKYMTYYNGYYYFSAVDGVSGQELWRTDGTTGGTNLFLDIFNNANDHITGSNPVNLLVYNDQLFFHADDVTHGRELYSTDGTAGNLVRTIDLNKVPSSSTTNYGGVSSLVLYNDMLLFEGTDGDTATGLWMTRGDSASTTFLLEVDIYKWFSMIGDKFYFEADSGTLGYELFLTDGTIAGSYLTMNINPGGNSYPNYLVGYNDAVYFSAYDGNFEEMAMYYDSIITNPFIYPYTGFSPTNLVVYHDKLYFFANTGFMYGLLQGDGLWVYDVTNPVTTSVKDPVNETLNGIFPNPVSDYLFFDPLYKNKQAQLLDLSGGLITSFTVGEKQNLSTLQTGLYILNIEDENGQPHKIKLIKQ